MLLHRHEVVRDALALRLDSERDLSVVASVATSSQAVQAFAEEPQALVLMEEQTPGPNGVELMAELRDQKARDFYLDNHRLGDLRRYKKYYSVDLFPKGPYPGSTTGQIYNEAIDCWPLPTSEIIDNPNIPK